MNPLIAHQGLEGLDCRSPEEQADSHVARRELFDVKYLAENGYLNGQMQLLPVIAQYPNGREPATINSSADALPASTRVRGPASLDVDGERVRSRTDNTTGTPVQATNHYDGDDDNPAWTQETPDRYTRIVVGLTGMAAIFDSDSGTVDWQLPNLHGDIAATIHQNDQGLSSTGEATEYGTPRNTDDIGARRYGWLGAKQRAADAPAGIILMGVRVYNSSTGRFLQVDPIPGGSANPYDYAGADPVNVFDLDGRLYKCTCKCQLDGPHARCSGYIYGTGYGKTKKQGSAAGKRAADPKVPRGCYKRHCKCDCDKVGRRSSGLAAHLRALVALARLYLYLLYLINNLRRCY